ncbi:MAG: methyl-accepting chemotaxis protein [Ignavibacteriales bacterium]
MNWFNDLSIKSKLLICFSAVIVISISLGYIGISNIRTIEKQEEIMYFNMTAPQKNIAEIINYFQRIRVNTRDIILAKDQVERNEYIQRIAEYKLAIEKSGSEFETTILYDNLRNSYNDFIDKYKLYIAGVDKLILITNNNKTDEAIALLRSKEMFQTAMTAQEELDNILKLKNNNAKLTYLDNSSLSQNAIITMVILLLMGIVVSIALAFFVSNVISRGIKQISGSILNLRNVCISNLKTGAEMMARGKLDIRIETGTPLLVLNSKDEIGVLAKNVNEIITMTQLTVASVEKGVSTIREVIAETHELVQATIEGKLNKKGNAQKFEGGYKELVEGLNNTLDAVVQPLNEASEVLHEMAKGDLTIRMQKEYKGEFLSFKNNINTVSESLANALFEVTQAVHATASASNQISSSSEEMAAGAQEQSHQTTEIAGAIEEMSKTIYETSKNTVLAAEASKKAGEMAKDGGVAVSQTVEGMNRIAEVVSKAALTVEELGKSSDQIGEIVQVIDDIADQTNLLALNAAIEAARAGEQGRGFAVVADEVRKLAERTTKATKEIEAMIQKIQKDTIGAVNSIHQGTNEAEKGKELAQRSGKTLIEIIESTNKVVDIVNQVAAASEQQSSAAEQISKNIESISSVTQQSAAGVQQIARASEDLSRLTVNLQELTNRFKIAGSSNNTPDSSRAHFSVQNNGKLIRE